MKERKRALRTRIKELRDGDPAPAGAPSGRETWTASVFAKAPLARHKTLFSFLSFPSEPDTEALHALALEMGLTVGVPRVLGGDMGFYRLESARGPFARGAYGIREPAPDAPALWLPPPQKALGFAYPLLVAVPGLAFTADGRRLGRGGGYYDRFIEALFAEAGDRRGDITLMGLCPRAAILPDVPTESHDAPVDCLLTEMDYIICKPLTRAYHFRRKKHG